MTFAPAVATATSPTAVAFSGRARDFLKLLVRGTLLLIPTFGFYRFWLITQLRRHLWANTRIGGEALEYTGTAKEILIGFLVALAVLVPIYSVYFILTIMAEEQQAFASIPLVLILYVLGNYAVYQARRYRATRTVFRGIRFWMTGSGWKYAAKAIGWDFATMLTFGLALPWRLASLERYKMRHTLFGTLPGDFVGTGGNLFRRAGWLWVFGLAVIGFVAVAAIGGASPLTVAILGGAGFLAFPLLFPIFLAILMRWHLEGIRFGEARLVSELGKAAFYGIYVKLVLSSIGLLLGAGGAIALVAYVYADALMGLQTGDVEVTTALALALMTACYLAILLGFGVLSRYFLGRGVWAVVAGSLAVANVGALDQAVAAGQPVGGLGEGLANALDVGAI
jgi:uncharacterized membrane protein YjgN (DUF898 family)